MSDKVNALNTASPKNPRFATGKKTKVVEFEAALTAANSAIGDLLILAEGLSFADRISGLFPNAANIPALTAAVDNDLGFYYLKEDGTYSSIFGDSAVDGVDVLWNGVDLSGVTPFGNILTGENAALDHSQNIGELLGLGVDEEPFGGVILAITMNVANTATATVSVATHVDVATTAG